MKAIIITIGWILTVGVANAGTNLERVKLMKEDRAISFISRGHVVEVEEFSPECPKNALCSFSLVTKVKVLVELNGCLDRLGPVAFRTKYNDNTGKLDIYISAINIHNDESKSVMCFVIPTKTFEVISGQPFVKEDINLIFL